MSFRKPEQIEDEIDPRDTICNRVKRSAKEILEKAAIKRGKSLSWLTGRILEDYAEWLKKNVK